MQYTRGKSMLALVLAVISFNPLATQASAPRGLSDSNTVNVKDYGATGNGSTDDTSAISAAVNSAPPTGTTVLNVYFPTGTYVISSAITVPSNIRIFGNGNSSVLHQTMTGVNVFQGSGTASSMISNITVENLSFHGTGGFQNTYGLSLAFAQNVIFRNNSANSIPLISISAVPTSNESQLSAKLLVTNNRATGILGEGAAVLI